MAEPFRLVAVGPQGPQDVPPPPGARTLLEVYESLPLGVYSRLRTWDGIRLLGLELHMDRTDRSLAILGRPERLDRRGLRWALQQALASFPAPDAFVRFDVLFEAPAVLGHSATTWISLAPFRPVPRVCIEQGVTVRFTHHRRSNPLAKRARWVHERPREGTDSRFDYEHLLLDPEGYVLEGATSNFWGVRGKQVHTAGERVLHGVTRAYCLRLASELGLEAIEQALHRDELETLDEAFLTSSSRGVVPIVEIEGQAVGSGRPGATTHVLREAYDALARREARPPWPPPS